MVLNDEVKGQDPVLSAAWKKLKRHQKTTLNELWVNRFKKSPQVLRRAVREKDPRGFFAYEANFLKTKMVELKYFTPEQLPGMQLEIQTESQPDNAR